MGPCPENPEPPQAAISLTKSASRQTIRKSTELAPAAAPMWVMPNHEFATAIKAPTKLKNPGHLYRTPAGEHKTAWIRSGHQNLVIAQGFHLVDYK